MDGVIFFQFGSPDAVDNSFFAESFEIFIENNGSYTFVLVFRMNANQVKNNVFAVFSGFEQMIKSKREKFAFGFL